MLKDIIRVLDNGCGPIGGMIDSEPADRGSNLTEGKFNRFFQQKYTLLYIYVHVVVFATNCNYEPLVTLVSNWN